MKGELGKRTKEADAEAVRLAGATRATGAAKQRRIERKRKGERRGGAVVIRRKKGGGNKNLI